jgi:N-acetylglucosamine-6-phosphate deacetylase
MDRVIKAVTTQALIPLFDVIRMISETPARIMGIQDRKGSLRKGKDADILLIDKNYDLCGVIAMGKIIKPI